MKVLIVLLLASITDLKVKAWSYNAESQWPGTCQTGKQQSPIHIMTRDVVTDLKEFVIKGPLIFHGYNQVIAQGKNNGHTLQWDAVPGQSPPVLSGGPLTGNYTFAQFHLHWLSEHAVDGKKYPLEIHMVHVKSELTFDQALARPDGLAVVGIFALINHVKGSDEALNEIMSDVLQLKYETSLMTPRSTLDLTKMLSPEPQSYFTYKGSLTTPNCEEVVTWIVMDKPIYITNEQYRAFYTVNITSTYNYRSLQPTNRIVYKSSANCATILLPTFIGTLANLLSCLSSTLSSGLQKGYCAILKVKNKLLGDSATVCRL